MKETPGAPSPDFRVFCDFDGTVCLQDIGNSFLHKHGGPDWMRAEQEFLDSKIGSREALVRQYCALDASSQDLERFVAQETEIDPTFVPFLNECRRRGAEVVVLSDGLDLYIRPFLASHGLEDLPLFCNHGIWAERHIEIEFPYFNPVCGICANCKTSHLERLRKPGVGGQADEKVVYVGDGWSDRCPARHADQLFAKGRLEQFCQAEGIPYIPFERFADVGQVLFGPVVSVAEGGK